MLRLRWQSEPSFGIDWAQSESKLELNMRIPHYPLSIEGLTSEGIAYVMGDTP